MFKVLAGRVLIYFYFKRLFLLIIHAFELLYYSIGILLALKIYYFYCIVLSWLIKLICNFYEVIIITFLVTSALDKFAVLISFSYQVRASFTGLLY